MSDQRVLSALGTGFTAFSGPAPPRMQTLDLQNVPGMNSQIGMILSMVLQPLITQMTSQMGFAGLQMGGTQSLYDRYVAQDFFLESRKAVMEAQRRDQDTAFKQLLGVAKITGTVIDANVERAAMKKAGDITSMLTVLGDIAPDFADELGGIRGSSAVMARRIHLGGRYAFDPTTGQLGLLGDTAGAINNRIYDNLLGPNVDLAATTKGLGAGRIGQLYDELQRRGFLSGGAVTREESFARLAAREGFSALDYAKFVGRKFGMDPGDFDKDPQAAMDKVASMPEMKELFTKAEGDRVSSKLKNLVGAVAAMRDIFGDLGKPNAPMAELINGLQALTQGGLATMSGGELEKIVRQTHMLSRMGGVSMESMMQLMSRGAGLSDQLGLDRRFSILATQGSVAFATAYGATAGSGPGWRAADKDTMMSIDQSLRLNAAKSDMSSQFNATMRIADEIGVRKGSEFEAMAAAIAAGKTQYQFGGETRSVAISFERWAELAADAGISKDVAYSIRTNRLAGQEYGARYNTGDLSRLLQRDQEIAPLIRMSGDIAYRGVAGDKAGMLSARATELLFSGKFNIRDPQQRYSGLIAGLSEYSKQLGLNLSDQELREASVRMWSDLEQRVGENPLLQGYGGAINMLEAHNDRTQALGQSILARSNDRSQLAGALSGLGRTGILRRFMTMLEQTDGSVDVGTLVGKVLAGGVKSDELNKALTDMGMNYRAYQSADPNTDIGRAQRAEAVKRLKEVADRANEAALKAGLPMDTSAPEAAAVLLNAVGRGNETPGVELIARLQDPENRVKATSMAQAYQSMQKAIAGRGLNPFEASDAAAIKKLIGDDDFKKLEPLLKAIESGKIEEALEKSKDKVQQVALSAPITIGGDVRIVGDMLLFEDVQSVNHRVPVENT